MILSSGISLKFANSNKKRLLNDFIAEYQRAVEFYVDYLWIECGIDKQNYNVSKYISSDVKPISNLSARALKCAATQSCGIVKSRVKKLSKYQYIIKKHQKNGKDISNLQSKYDKLLDRLKKPNSRQIYPELNSICCSYMEKKTKEFDGLFILFSLGKSYGKISIPVKHTKHFNHLSAKGNKKTSFLITNTKAHMRFDFVIEEKKIGSVEGADQGISTCVTVSDGQVTKKDIHGHDLKSILKKISRKKKGSKAFRRAQHHRTNYINWSIKQLNFDNIKQLNLEKLRNVGKGKSKSRLLQSFSYKEIRTAIAKTCSLAGVQLKETSNAYRSQRCNNCGFVHKSSRRGELFKCKPCGYTNNADLNAAMNHRDILYDLPSRFRHLPNKTSGFYWTTEGLFDVGGSAITVPVASKDKM
jgi:transposase